MLKIGKMQLGAYQTNCYFLYRDGSDKCILIDPADAGERIYDALAKNNLYVDAILLTHAHFDHIWGIEGVLNKADVKVYALDAESRLCESTRDNLSKWAGRPCTVKVDEYLHDGEERTIGGITFRVIATPGHTQGSCCFYFEEEGFLVSGDTLFLESTGRTDFPTGSMSQIVRSIREKLFCLPEDTKVYPGHGDSTTIGHEKKYNPFVTEAGEYQ